MSLQSWSVLSIIGVYFVYLLLPLIPTVIIYKLFPKNTVTIRGLIQGLQINAAGAFAAYIVTVLLGTFIAKAMIGIIEGTYVSRVVAEIDLTDEKGNPIYDPKDLAQLTVDLVPPIFNVTDTPDLKNPKRVFKEVIVSVPRRGDDWYLVKYTVPNYESMSVNVATSIQSEDAMHNTLYLHRITLHKQESNYSTASVLAQPGAVKGAYPNISPR